MLKETEKRAKSYLTQEDRKWIERAIQGQSGEVLVDMAIQPEEAMLPEEKAKVAKHYLANMPEVERLRAAGYSDDQIKVRLAAIRSQQ
jgi:hypothetical protein